MSGIKILKLPIIAALVILLLGFGFKIAEWPHASEILLFGFFSLLILYYIRFYKKSTKRFSDYIKMTLVLFWTINGILQILDFKHGLFFQLATLCTFVAWFILEGTAYFIKGANKNPGMQIIWNAILVLGVLGLIIGGLFKFMDIENATLIIALGAVLTTTFILKDILLHEAPKKEESEDKELQI